MNYREQYQNQGYLSPIDILDPSEAEDHRRQLELAEARIGNMHYLPKVHTIHTSPAQLARHPKVLDLVEQIIGPDILVYNVAYIIKESHSDSYVSWHQDLTYWGLDGDDQISLWLALSDASIDSGCMRVIPGSHTTGQREHILDSEDDDNVLYRNQRIDDVDDSQAVYCDLKPGQASFHHGWLLHSSSPNQTADRRIGLNIQYVAPQVRQTKLDGYAAWLVRGEDRFGHYQPEKGAVADLDPIALESRLKTEQIHRGIVSSD